MADKQTCIKVFNSLIRGTPESWNDVVFPLISEYLTEVKYENYEKLISLIGQNPNLAQQIIPDMVRYYCQKYQILSISKNNQILVYYE